jgi:DNA-binding LytR/AlgR family response regulator
MNKTIHHTSQTIKVPGVHNPILVGSITHCKGYGNYTRIYCKGLERPIVASRTLKLFENQLPDFLRANKSTLINHRYIVSVDRHPDGLMELAIENDSPVAVSRRRKQGIWDKLILLRKQSSYLPD